MLVIFSNLVRYQLLWIWEAVSNLDIKQFIWTFFFALLLAYYHIGYLLYVSGVRFSPKHFSLLSAFVLFGRFNFVSFFHCKSQIKDAKKII